MEKKKKSIGYYSLSYKERFVRTLVLFPVAIIAVFLLDLVYDNSLLTLIVAIVVGLVGIIQALYNYKKWKQDELDEYGNAIGESIYYKYEE